MTFMTLMGIALLTLAGTLLARKLLRTQLRPLLRRAR